MPCSEAGKKPARDEQAIPITIRSVPGSEAGKTPATDLPGNTPSRPPFQLVISESKCHTVREKFTLSTLREQPIMMTQPNDMDVVRGFPKTNLRLFGHSLAFEDYEDAMDQAVSLYWQHHGCAALSHQLAVWLLCVARRERATSMMVRVDDCGVITVDTEFETKRSSGEPRTLNRNRWLGEQDASR